MNEVKISYWNALVLVSATYVHEKHLEARLRKETHEGLKKCYKVELKNFKKARKELVKNYQAKTKEMQLKTETKKSLRKKE